MQANYQLSPEATNKLIQNRRSVFPAQYSGEKIDQKIIEQILENANWAPTHKYTEPWRFIVFHGTALEKLADYQAQVYKKNTLQEVFSEAKFNKLRNNPRRASHVIAIIYHRDAQVTIPEIEEVAAVSCAVQNMHLTATAYGLGAYWSTSGLTYQQEAIDFLDLSKEDKLMGFFYLGVIEKAAKVSRRKPIKEKVRWIGE